MYIYTYIYIYIYIYIYMSCFKNLLTKIVYAKGATYAKPYARLTQLTHFRETINDFSKYVLSI